MNENPYSAFASNPPATAERGRLRFSLLGLLGVVTLAAAVFRFPLAAIAVVFFSPALIPVAICIIAAAVCLVIAFARWLRRIKSRRPEQQYSVANP